MNKNRCYDKNPQGLEMAKKFLFTYDYFNNI